MEVIPIKKEIRQCEWASMLRWQSVNEKCLLLYMSLIGQARLAKSCLGMVWPSPTPRPFAEGDVLVVLRNEINLVWTATRMRM